MHLGHFRHLWERGRFQSVTNRGEPPLSRTAVLLIGQEVTVDDRKARRELGYRAEMSVEAGLAEMRAA